MEYGCLIVVVKTKGNKSCTFVTHIVEVIIVVLFLLIFLPSHAIVWNGIAIVLRLSVRLSVTLMIPDHICWAT